MSTNHRLVQRFGLALIAAGVVAGAAVYAMAGDSADVDAMARQREMREVDRLGGTATVQTVKFNGWLASLFHGRTLGLTLAVLGLVVGGACWHVGGLIAEETPDD